jgi:hypothetical protein
LASPSSSARCLVVGVSWESSLPWGSRTGIRYRPPTMGLPRRNQQPSRCHGASTLAPTRRRWGCKAEILLLPWERTAVLLSAAEDAPVGNR